MRSGSIFTEGNPIIRRSYHTISARLRSSHILLFCSLLVSFCLATAVYATPQDKALDIPVGQAQVDPNYYQYDSTAPFSSTVTPDGTDQGVTRLRVTYPSPVVTPFAANNTVTAFLFQPNTPGPHPVVLILHEWLPPNLKDESNVAVALAKAGITAFIVEEPYSLDRRPVPHVPSAELLTPDVPAMVANVRQCVLDSRRGLDWLSQRPDIDSNRIAVSGISLGAVICSLVAGVDHRVKAVVSIDGGADVADLIWSSPFLRGLHPGIVQAGYTRLSLRAAMAPVESSNWLHGFDPKNGLLFNGRYDVFIKPENAEMLSKALGGSHIVWLNTGHYGLAFSVKPLYESGVKFLYSRFYPNSPPYTPPDTLTSQTIKFGMLFGGHEGISPDLAYQILNFDQAGRYSLDGQLTLHGLSGGLSARLTTVTSVGLELPVFHGAVKPKPYLLLSVTL
jgi:hypothetical protein